MRKLFFADWESKIGIKKIMTGHGLKDKNKYTKKVEFEHYET